ncbi:hypothetical protein GCM10027577_34460 [Spirosoma fluminis]
MRLNDELIKLISMRLFSGLTLSLLVALTGCQSRQEPRPDQYVVPAEVERYVQAFREEAQQRNQALTITNLVIQFGATSGRDVCGQCSLEAGKPPTITLSKEPYCWQNASEAERECLVFHELGHCVLNRAHNTARLPNGAFASLMNPDDVSLYATCRYPIGDEVCDKRPRRLYYVDELFNANTPAPAWGN